MPTSSWSRATCDGGDLAPIVAQRFKCLDRQEYNLCAACLACDSYVYDSDRTKLRFVQEPVTQITKSDSKEERRTKRTAQIAEIGWAAVKERECCAAASRNEKKQKGKDK